MLSESSCDADARPKHELRTVVWPGRCQVMDMTATSFPNASFGLVLDKGGLDALMGDGDADSLEAGEKLLREVGRLLLPDDSAYVCVTLAQEHVLGAATCVASAARGAGWPAD